MESFSPEGLLEKIGMSARTHEDDQFVRTAALQPIDQQKVAADVALAVIRPFAHELMILPLGRHRTIIRDQQQHRLFELLQVEATRVR